MSSQALKLLKFLLQFRSLRLLLDLQTLCRPFELANFQELLSIFADTPEVEGSS